MNPNKIHGKKSQFWRESIFFYKNQYISKVRKSYRDLGAANDSTLSAWQLASRILPQAAPKGPKKFCDYRKSVIFRRFLVRAPLCHSCIPTRWCTARRLLRWIFPNSSDAREGMRTVWHLTRAMTSVPNTLSPAGSIFSIVNLIFAY